MESDPGKSRRNNDFKVDSPLGLKLESGGFSSYPGANSDFEGANVFKSGTWMRNFGSFFARWAIGKSNVGGF